jgi:hypothetical protein
VDGLKQKTGYWKLKEKLALEEAMDLSWSARPRPTALLPPRSNGKPEAATAVIELLMMGMRMPETCSAVFKRQVINRRNCCIWLVDSFER